MRLAKLLCGMCLLVLALSTVGCATPNKTMQSLAQRFKMPKMKSDTAVARKDASKSDQRVNALLDDAIASWSDGDTEETRKLLNQAIKRSPQNREARHLMANLLTADQEYEAAEVHLRAALKSDPNDARTHHALAAVLEQAGDAEGAAKHMTRAQELDSSVADLVEPVDSDSGVSPVSFSEQVVAPAKAGGTTSFTLSDEE